MSLDEMRKGIVNRLDLEKLPTIIEDVSYLSHQWGTGDASNALLVDFETASIKDKDGANGVFTQKYSPLFRKELIERMERLGIESVKDIRHVTFERAKIGTMGHDRFYPTVQPENVQA